MNANPLDLTLLALACFLLGIILGILVTGFRANLKVNQAYANSKKEFDDEKARLSLEVTEQMVRMRDGLKASVDAYESTLRVLATRLPLAEHGLHQLDGSREPLHLPDLPRNMTGNTTVSDRKAATVEASTEQSAHLADITSDSVLNGTDSNELDEQKIPLGGGLSSAKSRTLIYRLHKPADTS